jgi:hypothetical protein
LAGALAAALLAASGAQAATYILNFTGNDGSTAAFDLTTANTVDAVGGYDVLAITGGNVNGDAISGLLLNPNQPSVFVNNAWQYDNVLFPGSDRLVDYYGVVGNLASGGTTNLFSNSSTDYELMISPASGGYSLDSHGMATITAVPEPAAWALVIAGLFAVGAALRRSRKAPKGTVVA